MSLESLQQELNKINNILPKIIEYDGKILSEVPADLRKELSQIKIIPSLTSSGLEKVEKIIDNLYLVQVIVEGKLGKNETDKVEKSAQPKSNNETLIQLATVKPQASSPTQNSESSVSPSGPQPKANPAPVNSNPTPGT